jgi:hypothetical protein
VRNRLPLIAVSVALATASGSAHAQLFQNPEQRTILLSPGWHLSGPPVRSATGLRFAVRSDAGVMKDMTVLPNGAVTFSGNGAASARRAGGPRQHAAPKLPKAVATRRVEHPAGAAPTDTAATPAREAIGVSAQASAAPLPVPQPTKAVRALPAPQPAPPQTGPGFAHGVPINPLD